MQLGKGVEHVRGHGNDSGLTILGLAQRKLPPSQVHVRPFQLEQFPLAWPNPVGNGQEPQEMRRSRGREPGPFLRTGDPVSLVLGVRFQDVARRVIQHQLEPETLGDIKHVREGGMVMVHSLDGRPLMIIPSH